MCLMAVNATGQETQPKATQEQQAQPQPLPTEVERTPLLLPVPTATPYPLELFGLLGPPRPGVVLEPSLALSFEFVDNVFLSNTNKQSDFITIFTPAVSLSVNRPRYRLVAGLSTSAEIYAKESDLDRAFANENFLISADYTASPTLTLHITDTLGVSRNTSATNTFTTGRQLSLSNWLSPGLSWQATPRTTFAASAGYGVLRFFDQGSGADSDQYSFYSTLSYAFTRRLSGSIGYNFLYLDLTGEPNSATHNPTIGLGFQFTPSLSAAITGGPAITQIESETFISPAGNASITWRGRAGTLLVQYYRTVAVAGGFGGTTDTQVGEARLTVATWIRDLTFLINPSYTTAKSVDSAQVNQVNVEAYRLNLLAAYRLSRYAALFGGYEFIHQRTRNSSTQQVDADQNRVRIGLQIGYPFSLD
jgi:hypothetical protein